MAKTNPFSKAYAGGAGDNPSSGVGNKISQIMSEGIRRDTKKPVGPGNKRRPVGQKQAVAVALNMKKRGAIA